MGKVQNPKFKIQSQLTIALVLLFGLVAAGSAEPRGWLGVYNYTLDEATQIALGVPHGVMVKEVVTGSPAEKAGLKVGDVLLSVDSEELLSTEDLSDYVGNRPEQNVRLIYCRQGKTDSTTVKIGIRERQLELTMESVPTLTQTPEQIRPMMRNMIDEYMAQIRALREQINELSKDIERLRKDLKKNEKK